MINKRINNRYLITQSIGGGGMSTVYLAKDLILDRDVAIKILRSEFAGNDEFIRRFNREAHAVSVLAHPNIVSIYDVGEEDGLHYIVMEYVDGMTLKKYIQTFAPVPMQKVVEIMLQITSAVSHAHEQQIIHRDIKPQNILINHDGVIKITDFGIAIAASSAAITQTNSVLGSVHYLSPEQAGGQQANRKSDIYSLGIVMFELLTGRLPFQGESAVSIALKHLQSSTPSPRMYNPNIPQSIENVVLRATAKNPFNRYNTAEEMQLDIETSLSPERMFEPKYVEPQDADLTKTMPIIKDAFVEQSFGDDSDWDLEKIEAEVDDNLEETAKIAKPVKKVAPKPKPTSAEKPKKKNRKKIIIFGVIAFLALAFFVYAFFFSNFFNQNDVTVPDVTGKSLDSAVLTLENAGFEIGKKIASEDEQVEENLVIKTDPESGEKVKKGATVNIYYSQGPGTQVVGQYVGNVYEEIKTQLEDSGFKEVVVKRESNSEVEEGVISKQSPEEGTEVKLADTILVLTVSTGKEKITLENLTGFNSDDLASYADKTGLVIKKKEAYSDTVPEGEVISMSPSAGKEVVVGSTVTVTISKGKKIVTKDITRTFSIKYDGIAGAPQTIRVYISDLKTNMNEPFETFTITADVQKTYTFNLDSATVGSYRIMKDNTVIDEGKVYYQ